MTRQTTCRASWIFCLSLTLMLSLLWRSVPGVVQTATRWGSLSPVLASLFSQDASLTSSFFSYPFVVQCPEGSVCYDDSPCKMEGQAAPSFVKRDTSKMFCGGDYAAATACGSPCPSGSDGKSSAALRNESLAITMVFCDSFDAV